MSPAGTPRPPRVPRDRPRPQQAAPAPRIRSDESTGRPEDTGSLLPPRPAKPVRFTLDLDQERHTFLKQFAIECGAGVGGAQVMRALLDELREGSNLPMRVKARIRSAGR